MTTQADDKQALPAEWLACPRCERAPLGALDGRYRCVACRIDFPSVGGIPWLFAEPGAALGEWRSRVAASLQTLRHEAARFEEAARAPNLGGLTRARLNRLAEAAEDHARRLTPLLEPLLMADASGSYEAHAAFRTPVPWDQGLLTYAYNIYRDWSWGQAENQASLEIVANALGAVQPGRVLVLGAGAGRLAYDLHMSTSASATVVLDFNPFLLLLARRMTTGGSISLYERPLAPLSLESSAVLRTLSAEGSCRAGLYYALADVLRAPFVPGVFDTVVTPWLVDILPGSFEDLCRRVNALLAVGGRWVNFGSLNFHVTDPALQHSPEECAEVIAATGFQAPHLSNATIPYLSSPASRHGRVERVLSWAASKQRDVPNALRPGLLPGWLVDGRESVPLLEVFRTQAPATRIRGYILSLIDGRRSLNEIVALFDQQKIMTHEEAEATIRSLLMRMFEANPR